MAGVGDVSAADVEAREHFLRELVPGGAGGCSVWAVEALPACVREVCQVAGVDEGYLSRCPDGAGRWFLLVLVVGWRWCVAWPGWEGARADALPPVPNCPCDLRQEFLRRDARWS